MLKSMGMSTGGDEPGDRLERRETGVSARAVAIGYLESGDKKSTIENYKKSLELDPRNDNAREV